MIAGRVVCKSIITSVTSKTFNGTTEVRSYLLAYSIRDRLAPSIILENLNEKTAVFCTCLFNTQRSQCR